MLPRWSYSQGKLSANRAFRTNATCLGGNTRALRRTLKFSPCRRLLLYCRRISHYYSAPTLKAKLLNLVAKRRIARDTQATLNASKSAIETAQAE